MGDRTDRILRDAGLPQTDESVTEVVSRLFQVVTYIERILAAKYGEGGLERAQVDVLYALERGGEALTPTQVAARLVCSSGAMTNRLDRLEAAGYVRRLRDADDRRTVRLLITPAGRAASSRASEAREAAGADLLPTLSAQERRQLVRLLRKMLMGFEGVAPPERLSPSTASRSGRPTHVGSQRVS